MTWGAWLVGLLMVWWPHRVGRRVQDQERRSRRDPSLSLGARLGLVAAALDAGLRLPQAVIELARAEDDPELGAVADRLEWGLSWPVAWEIANEEAPKPGRFGREPRTGRRNGLADLYQALEFSAATGSPAAAILRARIGHVTQRQIHEAERLATVLGVKLVLPLGLCSLPALVCWGVLPVLIGLVSEGTVAHAVDSTN